MKCQLIIDLRLYILIIKCVSKNNNRMKERCKASFFAKLA